MMSKRKHKFTKEEKELIHQMKDELKMMGIPRDQWSLMIQDSLKAQKKRNRFFNNNEEKNGIKGAFQRVRNNIEGKLQKIIAKRYNMEDSLENLFGDMNPSEFEENMGFMNDLLFGKAPNLDNISEHGTFLGNRPDKKRMIVHFDEEEE